MNTTPPDFLLDGNYALGIEVGRAAPVWPFRQNGDVRTLMITRQTRRRLSNYVRGTLGVDTDRVYKDAYLIDEPDPVPTQDSDVILVSKTFSRIPSEQVVPTSLFITKPELSAVGTPGGSILDYTTNEGATGPEYGPAFVLAGKTYSRSKAYTRTAASSTVTAASGGTFTLTYGANTTAALAYNETNGNISAALNALASVSAAGLTFACINGLTAAALPTLQMSITAGSTTTPVTMNAASLTPAAASTAFTWVPTNILQFASIAGRVTITAHGFNASNPLLAYTNGTHWLLPATTKWSVIDANTIAFWYGQQAGPFTIFGQSVAITYAAGTALVRAKRVTNFYLPGITPGIATIDDIPLPAYQGDPATLVEQIIAGNTAINYEVGELTKWRDGPILARTITTINGATL